MSNLVLSSVRTYKEILQNTVSSVSLRKAWHEAFWVFVGQAGTAIGGLIGVKLLTHVLIPAEYGKLALANTIVALIGTNLFGPIGQGIGRYWSICSDRGDLDVFYKVSSYLSRIVSLCALLMCGVGLLLFIGVSHWTNWTILVGLALVVGIVLGNISIKVGVFTAARQRRRTALLNISNNFLRPLMAVILIVLTIRKAEVALGGHLVAALIILFAVEMLYLKNVSEVSLSGSNSTRLSLKIAISEGVSKEILTYSWPFLVWGIFSWVHMSCARWSLQVFHGSAVVGAFAVVSILAMYPLSFGSGFLTTLLTPIAFQRAGALKDSESISFAYKILIGMTGVYILGLVGLIGLFSGFHNSLVMFISDARYVKYSYLLPWLTLAWGLFYFGQVTSSFGLLANRPHSYIAPKITSAIVAGVATFYLSYKVGPAGVVAGLGLAGFVYALWCCVIALRVLKM